jgi:anti-sigma factor RsiW
MAICRDVVENIIDYIEKELDDKTLEELEKHASDCPECQAFVRTYTRMLELTGKLKERTFVTPQIRKRLKDFLRSQIKSNKLSSS